MSAISVGKEMEKDVSVAKLFLMESPPGMPFPFPDPFPVPFPIPFPTASGTAPKLSP